MLKYPRWNPSKPIDRSSADDGGGLGVLNEQPAVRTRRVQVVAIALAVIWVLYWYRDTALAMEAIWHRSETFAHGYLVVPIALWLVWRQREVLSGLPLRPSIFGFLAGLASGFCWLLAELVSVDAVAQFALIGMLVSTVWSLAGTAVARRLAFPLGFLFFCVPFGEFLYPYMMDWTAEFVVRGLRLSGIPVFVEGRSIVVPTGHWQVVEECSGFRYLIASAVVGSLYGYLTYRSNLRRAVFVIAAVATPILANWLRAYGIVVLGHVSGNRLATGVDHVIYGWVFFGIVMMSLFWLGAKWQQAGAPQADLIADSVQVDRRPEFRMRTWAGIAIAIIGGLSMAHPTLNWLEVSGEKTPVTLATLVGSQGWTEGSTGDLPEWSPEFSGMAASARSVWSKGENWVGVYLGYFRDQRPGRELINSENKIILSTDPVWQLVAYGDRIAALPEAATSVRSTEIQSQSGRLLVWHWYWIGGRVTSNDYVAKVLLALAKLRGWGDDSAVVVLYTPVLEYRQSQAETVLAEFARETGPSISKTLAGAAGR